MSRKWGPLRSLLVLTPILIGAPWFSLKIHTTLPAPLTDLTNPASGLPQISEAQILHYAQHLSEGIGYRTLGTREHALADQWMVQKAESIKQDCDRLVKNGRKLECEIWRQEGSGSHRFDMMNKRLYKTYVNITNIVVRISDGTPEGKADAVLVNAHLDSTLPSPGAADDAICVGVMLECIRVLINTPDWSPKHAIIFLFNHAEESLQDGSHLFATQHPVASTARAMVNLEAAGTTGRELLFQATSVEMVEAYSHVPRPFGTVFANDIFTSGVLLSDTDFRQFEQYLNITGLDIAIVGNSYLYHMRKDLVEYIQPGVAQNMGENTLALLQYLSSPSSPLPSLTTGYSRPMTVYFAYFGHFFVYSFKTAKILYGLLLAASLALVRTTHVDPAPASKRRQNVWAENVRGTVYMFAAISGAVIAPNLVAAVMRYTGHAMSWFSREYAPLLLYGPAALFGVLSSQILLGRISERTLFTSLLLTQAVAAFGIQLYGIGSAAMFFLAALPMFATLLLNQFVAPRGQISLWTYAFGSVPPLLVSTIIFYSVNEVFVPLTGRIGADAPADHIVAGITSLAVCQAFPLALPFSHRFGARALRRAVAASAAATVLAMAVFSTWQPFDDMHQKRLFVLHLENVTTQVRSLHLAAADGAPGFEELVHDVAREFGAPGVVPVGEVMDDYNPDWNALYPFSAFLRPYRIQLPMDPTYEIQDRFLVSALNDVVDVAAGTRSLTLKVHHPGLIWTVIAFDAHVLRWTLDDNPPDEYARHHIKEASFYGIEDWTVDLVIRVPPTEAGGDGDGDMRLWVNFVGLKETGMWPAKRAEKEAGGDAMRLFERLDGWLERETGGTVDATLLGCVGGMVVV